MELFLRLKEAGEIIIIIDNDNPAFPKTYVPFTWWCQFIRNLSKGDPSF